MRDSTLIPQDGHVLQIQHTQDNALDMLADDMQSNKTRVWNSVEVHEQYIQLCGTDR